MAGAESAWIVARDIGGRAVLESLGRGSRWWARHSLYEEGAAICTCIWDEVFSCQVG
ncbi:MAG: hypothetical protein RR354_05380 [Mucinivorans sp.]